MTEDQKARVQRIRDALLDSLTATYREGVALAALADCDALLAEGPAQSVQPQDERASFEAWANDQWAGRSIPDNAWLGWQARAALAAPASETEQRAASADAMTERDSFQEAVLAFRKAAYEFGMDDELEDHATMLVWQRRIFALYDAGRASMTSTGAAKGGAE